MCYNRALSFKMPPPPPLPLNPVRNRYRPKIQIRSQIISAAMCREVANQAHLPSSSTCKLMKKTPTT